MKKFTKLFLSCALVSAMAVTASSAVFAEEVDITGTGISGKFDPDAKTITNLALTDTIDANSEVTFLVFKGGKDTTVNADVIEGIDQNTNEAAGTDAKPVNNGLKSDVAAPAEGQQEYTVMVGYYNSGTFKTATGSFKLGTAPAGVKYMIGDADGDEDITISDASAIAQHLAKKKVITDEIKLKAADADLDEDLTISDASAIAQHLAKKKISAYIGTFAN